MLHAEASASTIPAPADGLLELLAQFRGACDGVLVELGVDPEVEPLTSHQLAALVSDLNAQHRPLLLDLGRHDERPDRYTLEAYSSRYLDLWLLGWDRHQRTDWHDHGTSAAAIVNVRGRVRNETHSCGEIRSEWVLEGEVWVLPPPGIHCMGNGYLAGEEALTLHAYSGPECGLGVMTIYKVDHLDRLEVVGCELAPVGTWRKDDPGECRGAACGVSAAGGDQAT